MAAKACLTSHKHTRSGALNLLKGRWILKIGHWEKLLKCMYHIVCE